MKIRFFIVFVALCLNYQGLCFSSDSLSIPSIEVLTDYYKSVVLSDERGFKKDVSYSEEQVNALFREMNTEIEVNLNDNVLSYIQHILRHDQENFEIALALYHIYNDSLSSFINKMNMPAELAMLPFILSGMNPSWSSDSGAGLWNLNYYVALKYGLRITEYYDERKNVKKSTEVALLYLQELYQQYNSWDIAITAFATSKLVVEKALKKASEGYSYKDIRPFLPTSSANIIPSYHATIYVTTYFPEHDLIPPILQVRQKTQIFASEEPILIDVLAKHLDINPRELLVINPEFRGNYVPRPQDSLEFFIPQRKNIETATLREKLIAETRVEDRPEVSPVTFVQYGHAPPENMKKITHVVKSGDVVGTIAEKYKVRASNIRNWNSLRNNRIYIGQKLSIYIEKDRVVEIAESPPKEPISVDQGKTFTYEVKEGDTLWDIVKDNPGNSIEKVQRINSISANLKPGQKIKLMKAQ